MNKEKICIVGGGVAGITAAHYLQDKYEVTLLEKNDYIGGHTNTSTVLDPELGEIPVDTGFIVLNDKTYPGLHALLKELNVPVRWSNMSFSYHSLHDSFQYAGNNINGLFGDRKNILSPSFYRFLFDIKKFCQKALIARATGEAESLSLADFLKKHRILDTTRDYYILPMGAAIWSTPSDEMLKFPASTFINFLFNHGLLAIRDRPRWQTVVGGSRSYVEAFLRSFTGKVKTQTSVTSVKRASENIEVTYKNEKHIFDQVIFACHADTVLSLLASPSKEEENAFSNWKYNKNHTVLHTDSSFMPQKKRLWSSWNYREERQGHLSVTYAMNILQGIDSTTNYFVTLNPRSKIDPSKVIAQYNYTHPLYSSSSITSQKKIADCNGIDRVWFAGSYTGYGFHEDAVQSSLSVVQSIVQQLGESV